ncbi:MurR/RpiR family transcriptional regulator [Halomonas huangheensis]|uniref:DNA-binding protein n=1 Tax=Halomonas huangheensis TaxID=1178482 RepID=W1N7P7_9GAMM|nr:MurR/RpiR family transcriptional regulator [Halomonas huangheensis]ALM53282.1 DNA-binding protein [Halomonas huangheensis]ERL51577.1 DNA-binding protein [Halomonas huangheensis]
MSKSSQQRSFLSRVRNALPSLHPAERRLGEFVCDFPGELASYDAQELARFANVSKATVSRFVRRLGYESYEAARKHARDEQQTGSRLFLTLSSDEQGEASLTGNLELGKENLERTFAAIPQAEVDTVAQAILDARKTWVIGFRASHPFADYLRWQLAQVVEEVVSLPGGGETLGEHLVNFGTQDCVIVFGLRRRVAITGQILAYARERGARLLYVTDEGVEPEPIATWHFRCHSRAAGPLFNHTSVMALCHLLAMRTIELAGEGSRHRLRRIETLNERLEEL